MQQPKSKADSTGKHGQSKLLTSANRLDEQLRAAQDPEKVYEET